tara:strand:+ start:8717 stop:10363 length:1647 start_codon:yes stop_codon:yes gene_type:complete
VNKPFSLQFPKEVGLFRKLIHDKNEFEKYWAGLGHSQCAYMSVYSFRAVKPNGRRAEYNTAIVSNFVLDFDKKYRKGSDMIEVDGDEVVDQVARLHDYLLEKEVSHAVWFSGNGFHIWIALDKTHLPSTGREVMYIKSAGRKVINQWKKDMSLYCMDPTVPFDMARMIRVPNSYNAKQHVLRWSIPLTTKDLTLSWDEICEMAGNPLNKAHYYGDKGISLPIKEVKDKNFRTEGGEQVHFDTVSMGKIKILPCLMEAACQVGSNPPHVSRASLVMYLGARLRNFLPVYRTTAEMRDTHVTTISNFIGSLQWADYDEGVTSYHTKTIVDGGYQESCASLISKGLCIGKCQLWDGTGEHDDEEDEDEEISITLSPEQLEWSNRHAEKTVQYHNSNGVGEYGHNSINGALVGVKSELAASVFFSQHFTTVVDNFTSNISKSDLRINARKIEIKGLAENHWEEYKRAIPPKQLDKYASRNAIVVWTTVDNHNHPRNKVILRGWNHAYEVKEKGEFIKTVCDNIQLKNDKDMRRMGDLVRVLNKIGGKNKEAI